MSILNNAIDSIALGLEDYEYSESDERRVVSCARNIYAGILLLFKHKLSTLSDPETDEALIKERVIPKIVDGKVSWVGKGKKTVDYQSIKDRFESLGIQVDWERINKINDYRNNAEHYFSNLEPKAIQGLISNSFVVIGDFIKEELKEDPKKLLGSEAWAILVEVNEVYEKENASCVNSLKSLNFFSDTILKAFSSFSCEECGSDLIYSDSSNIDATESLFTCKSCEAQFYYEEIVSSAIEDYFKHQSYIAMTDGGDSPIADCPFCGGKYLYEEQVCSECGESAEHECNRCSSEIIPSELSEDGMCGYCSYVMQKDD